MKVQILAIAMCGILARAGGATEPVWQTFDDAGWTALRNRDYAAAKQQFDEAVRHASQQDQRLGRSLVGLAWARHRMGLRPTSELQQTAAHEAASRAYPLTKSPRTFQEQITRAENEHVLGRCEMHLYRLTNADRYLRDAHKRLVELPRQAEQLADVSRSLAELRTVQGQWHDAARFYAQAMRLTQDERESMEMIVEQTDVLVGLGKYRDATVQKERFAARYKRPTAEVTYSQWLSDLWDRYDMVNANLDYRSGDFSSAVLALHRLSPQRIFCPLPRCRCQTLISVLAGHCRIAQGGSNEWTSPTKSSLDWEQSLLAADILELNAEVAFGNGKYASAADQYRQALKQKEDVFGTDHPETIDATLGLMLALELRGDPNEEVPKLCDRVADACRRMGNHEHPQVALAHTLLAMHLANHDHSGVGAQLDDNPFAVFLRYDLANSAAERAASIQQVSSLTVHPAPVLTLEQQAFLQWTRVEWLGDETKFFQGLDAARRRAETALSLRQSFLIQDEKPPAEGNGNGKTPFPSTSPFNPAFAHLLIGWIDISRGQDNSQFQQGKEWLAESHPLRAEAELGLLVISRPPLQPMVPADVASVRTALVQRLGGAKTADKLTCLSYILTRHGRSAEGQWLHDLAQTIEIEPPPMPAPQYPTYRGHSNSRTLLQRLRDRIRGRR
jgi:tetratricopeptide (TPR) repeat protein